MNPVRGLLLLPSASSHPPPPTPGFLGTLGTLQTVRFLQSSLSGITLQSRMDITRVRVSCQVTQQRLWLISSQTYRASFRSDNAVTTDAGQQFIFVFSSNITLTPLKFTNLTINGHDFGYVLWSGISHNYRFQIHLA